jgi:hypothetical protein
MWKRSLVVVKQTIKFTRLVGAVAFAAVVSACAADATPVAQPTQILIPSTVTFTPSPVPPTNTPQTALAAPDEVTVATLPPASTAPPSASDNLLNVDPVAAELATLAQRRIAEDLGLPVRRVRVVEIEAYTWSDTSLGCPLPGETYAAVTVDGYRILLAAGDNEYIYHTDFDRALPCDADNEQLPEATPNT